MIGWYPGHMVKAQKDIKKNLSLVDFVVELLDARAPLSTMNTVFDQLLSDKTRYFLLTKKDMADESITLQFIDYFKKQDKTFFVCDLKNPQDWKKVISFIKQRHSKRVKRGLVVGVPNVGKSTFINNWVGRQSAKTQNRVGVTRQIQWHKNKETGIELLDTAGISMPHFPTKKIAYHMALIGSLRLEVIPHDEIVEYLISFLLKNYKDSIEKRYKTDSQDYLTILDAIAHRFSKLKKGEVNYDLVYELILNDFRKGLLGRVTLDKIDFIG